MTSLKETEQSKRKPQKKFKFQGVKKHLDLMKQLNNDIKELEEKILQSKERVDSRIEEFRKQTGQKDLFDSQEETRKGLESLKKERDVMRTDLKSVSVELKTLMQTVGEEKKKLNMKGAAELRNRLAQIDNRIREKPLSSKEEKEISTEKNRVIKLLSMQDIFKEKDEKIKELEDLKKTKESAYSAKKQEAENFQSKLNEINNKIGKIKKATLPEDIKGLQEKIAEMIEQKKTLFEQKKNEFSLMEKKSEEYELKAAEVEKAKTAKSALVDQEKLIEKLSHERSEVERDLNENPCENLKALKMALLSQTSHTKKSHLVKNISLPFSIVSQLVQFNMNIPKNFSEIDESIKKIDQIFSQEEKNFEQRKSEIHKKISSFDVKISEEKKKLDTMPRPSFPKFDNE
ncbi:hypothetical protein NEFER03_0766 [Nematocida sp. LUAm3]|nr:hypothetical protein NEFER03_0766 [Nematocida sp. LUAm3]KAI5175225.1 hypothetical protein NEFER02_1186 [Nematocida sp. LUAm2]KAI5178103.1 hypothetical protein NEFER01_1281 [Nematocida sp. LUAm1]